MEKGRHNLEKTKTRAWILFPPLILFILNIIISFIYTVSFNEYTIPMLSVIIYIVSSAWMLVGTSILSINDINKDKGQF